MTFSRTFLGLATLTAVFSLSPSTAVNAQRQRTVAKARVDAFARVDCRTDPVKTLVGGYLPNDPVVATEAAHTNIRLKDAGGSIINDNLFLAGWLMCGHEYQLVVKNDRVEDALQFPPHSRRQPAFLGSCTLNNKQLEGVLAVLDNPTPRGDGQPGYSPNDTTSLAAVAAWRIDEKKGRLMMISTKGLRCPRGGIFTRDGGT